MLNDKQCKAAICPTDKKHKRFFDEKGLYLEVSASSKRWFFKYAVDGVEKRLAIGSYPEVSLASARNARDVARLKRSNGVDPVQEKKLTKLTRKTSAANSFEAVALEWFEKRRDGWSEGHAIREKRNLEKDLFPVLGERPVAEIKPIELLAALNTVEERSSSIAHRVHITAGQVFRYAVATARADRDISADLKGALKPHRKKHFAAITDPEALGTLIRVIRGYQGGMIVRTALQLAPMLFQRPNELRGMAWCELDLDGATWIIPAARMKRLKDDKEQGAPHVVPLPTQAIALLIPDSFQNEP